MRLFSKRNKKFKYGDDFRYSSRFLRSPYELISSEARNRITSEIKFLSSNDDFLEWFILFENRKEIKTFFDKDKVDHFSLSELGYAMSNFFEFENFKIIQQERDGKYPENTNKKEKYFNDYALFDLAEIVILFAKDKKRCDVINRLNTIFSEEDTDYQIVEYLITKKSGETLKTLVTLLKNDNLRAKIGTFFDLYDKNEYVNSSKISADIINIILSGNSKDHKPQHILDIKKRLIKKIIKDSTKNNDKSKRFMLYFDDILKSSKNLSNDIYDIRHTEKSTIEIINENIYKMVSNLNMSLAELILTALKDDYVLGDNWEKIKNEYIKKYKIDKNIRLVIENPEKEQGDIKVEDIPF